MKRKLKTSRFILNCMVFGVFIFFSLNVFGQNAVSSRDGANIRFNSEYFDIAISEVISGDMLRMENGETVRLIGVDTPEVIDCNKLEFDSKISGVPIEVLKVRGNEARQFVVKMVENKRIRVEFDEKIKDNYGNLLGYVFLLPNRGNAQDDEIFINAEIIKRGYSSRINTASNDRYADLFKRLHEYAKQMGSQLWEQWHR